MRPRPGYFPPRPVSPTVTKPPIGQLVKNGGTLEFTYTRPKAALQELRYDLKTSASLSGTWNSAGQAATILSDNETTEQVKATNPAGTPSGSCGCG